MDVGPPEVGLIALCTSAAFRGQRSGSGPQGRAKIRPNRAWVAKRKTRERSTLAPLGRTLP